MTAAKDDDISLADLERLVSYNPLSGNFTAMRVRGSRLKPGRALGALTPHGHLRFYILGRTRLAHRLAWFMVHGKWPEHFIDHINGIGADNRIANLRSAPQFVNRQNVRSPTRVNKSGYLGVCWDKNREKFRSVIGVHGKRICLGWFDDPKVAHQAYLTAKRNLHVGCTI